MSNKRILAFFVAILSIFFGNVSATLSGNNILRMATTTSTDNTGLLDFLAPEFKKDAGIELQWVAVGTGKALELGKNCDVDVLLVHAPSAEKKYVAKGYGVDRTEIMYNDFVIIGPKDDPARIKGKSPVEALKIIAEKKALFVSRGDNSGTHKKELSLWKEAGLTNIDKAEWYIQTGQGMIATINVAAERGGYTLTDRGTYIKYEYSMKGNPPLVVLVEGDKRLYNLYSVIAVSPTRCPEARYEFAKRFIRWISSPRVQRKIGDYEILGKRLFVPLKAR